MFCKNCGTPLPDGSKFCVTCGFNLEAGEAQPVETPVVEPEVVTPDPAPAPEEFAQPWQPEEAVAPAPKKKSLKFLAWLIPVVAVVTAAAVALAVFWGPIQGWWLENFGPADDYRNFVQEKNKEAATSTVSKAYGAVLDVLSGKTEAELGAADISMKLNVSSDAMTLMNLALTANGQSMDLEWLKDLELKLSTNGKDGLQQIVAALNVGGQEAVSAEAILVEEDGMLYVENLKGEYVAINILEDIYGMGDAEMMMAYLQDDDLIKALPTEEELSELLNRYIDVILASFDDVKKSEKIVKAGGVEQSLTALETKIDGDGLVKAAEAVLDELSDDKNFEKILERFLKYLEKQDELGIDADEICDEFEDGIEDLKDGLDEVDGDDFAGEAVLTQYVNDKHEVVGYALEVEDEEVFRMVETRSGDKIGYRLKTPTFEIAGKGTEKSGAITGEYVITVKENRYSYENGEWNEWVEEYDALVVNLVDFKAEGEKVNGKIQFSLPEEKMNELLEQVGELPATVSSILDLAELKLELSFDTTEKSSAVTYSIVTGDKALVGVTMTVTGKEATDITLPDEAYDINDGYWERDIAEDLYKALEEAGLPMDMFGELGYHKVTPEEYSYS